MAMIDPVTDLVYGYLSALLPEDVYYYDRLMYAKIIADTLHQANDVTLPNLGCACNWFAEGFKHALERERRGNVKPQEIRSATNEGTH